MTTKMTSRNLLAHEAMRLGAMQFPQAFNGMMHGKGRCALASIQEACGIPAKVNPFCPEALACDFEALEEMFPVLLQECVNPDTGTPSYVLGMIYMLNDHYKWSRERIADWLQPIEEAFNASQVPVNVSTEEAVPVPVLV